MDKNFEKKLRTTVTNICEQRAAGLKMIGVLPADYKVSQADIDSTMQGLHNIYNAAIAIDTARAAVEQEAKRQIEEATAIQSEEEPSPVGDED